ncbi:MAG: hypothetical protein M1817_002234 [Caeruleum heppii]|nr:MAG: hypothetical protein M1817_002234 [Caeruleum heppii]
MNPPSDPEIENAFIEEPMTTEEDNPEQHVDYGTHSLSSTSPSTCCSSSSSAEDTPSAPNPGKRARRKYPHEYGSSPPPKKKPKTVHLSFIDRGIGETVKRTEEWPHIRDCEPLRLAPLTERERLRLAGASEGVVGEVQTSSAGPKDPRRESFTRPLPSTKTFTNHSTNFSPDPVLVDGIHRQGQWGLRSTSSAHPQNPLLDHRTLSIEDMRHQGLAENRIRWSVNVRYFAMRYQLLKEEAEEGQVWGEM